MAGRRNSRVFLPFIVDEYGGMGDRAAALLDTLARQAVAAGVQIPTHQVVAVVAQTARSNQEAAKTHHLRSSIRSSLNWSLLINL